MAMRERERVTALLQGEFPAMPQVECERCVDDAFDEIWHEGEGPLVKVPRAFRAQWIKRARWRALRECSRLRYRLQSGVSLSEPEQAESFAARNGDVTAASVEEEIEAARSEYRVEELLSSLTPQQRRLAEVLFGASPERRARRYLSQELGWSVDLWKYHAKGVRERMAAFLAAEQSGQLCAERRHMVDEYVEWSLTARAAGIGLCPEGDLHAERFRLLWLHLESCDACRAYARRVSRAEGAVQHALSPPVTLLAALLTYLRHVGALAKAKPGDLVNPLLPARARAAGGGGLATGGVLSGVGGKAVVCGATALVCAAGLIGSGALTLVAPHHAAKHRLADRRPHPAATVQPARRSAVPQAPRSVAVASRRSGRARRHARRRPPLPLTRLSEVQIARVARLPFVPTPAHAVGSRAPSMPAPGCSAPGDLGC